MLTFDWSSMVCQYLEDLNAATQTQPGNATKLIITSGGRPIFNAGVLEN